MWGVLYRFSCKTPFLNKYYFQQCHSYIVVKSYVRKGIWRKTKHAKSSAVVTSWEINKQLKGPSNSRDTAGRLFTVELLPVCDVDLFY